MCPSLVDSSGFIFIIQLCNLEYTNTANIDNACFYQTLLNQFFLDVPFSKNFLIRS